MMLHYAIEEGNYSFENSWKFYTNKSITEEFDSIVHDIAEAYYSGRCGFRGGIPRTILIWNDAKDLLGRYTVQIKHSPQFIIGKNMV